MSLSDQPRISKVVYGTVEQNLEEFLYRVDGALRKSYTDMDLQRISGILQMNGRA